jgi:hypothetical protein
MNLTLLGSRRALAALAVIAPAVGVAAIVIALEGYRAIQPDAILFVEPTASSLADALEHREVEVAYAFFRRGADPNAMLSVEDAALTGGQHVDVSPLMLAVASRNRNAVMMLLSAGVNLEVPVNRFAACLARDLGETDLETMIVRDADPQIAVACPPRVGEDRAPLLRYVTGARARLQ